MHAGEVHDKVTVILPHIVGSHGETDVNLVGGRQKSLCMSMSSLSIIFQIRRSLAYIPVCSAVCNIL